MAIAVVRFVIDRLAVARPYGIGRLRLFVANASVDEHPLAGAVGDNDPQLPLYAERPGSRNRRNDEQHSGE
jgi:hypothetical protein